MLASDANAQFAMPLFERAIDIAPANAEFQVNDGGALIQVRRLDDAVRALTTTVGLDPRSTNVHNNLGIALAQRATCLAPRRNSNERCS